jgi:hypothetical protein
VANTRKVQVGINTSETHFTVNRSRHNARTVLWLSHFFRIQDVPSSILGGETGHPDKLGRSPESLQANAGIVLSRAK